MIRSTVQDSLPSILGSAMLLVAATAVGQGPAQVNYQQPPAAIGYASQPIGTGNYGQQSPGVPTGPSSAYLGGPPPVANPYSQPANGPPAYGSPGAIASGAGAPAPGAWPYGQPPTGLSAYAPPPVGSSSPPAAASAGGGVQPGAPRQSVKPQPQLPPGSPPLGLEGYCPVTLVNQKRWLPGDLRWGAVHRGRTYLFLGAAEQKGFLENPDKYGPAMSGNDPVLALDQRQLVPGMRTHGVFFNKRIYLFSNEASLQQFNKNPRRYEAEVLQAMR